MKTSTASALIGDALISGPAPESLGPAWTDQLTNFLARMDMDIPKVYIDGDYLTNWVNKKDERIARLSYRSATRSFDCAVQIKPQGTSSMNYPKKNFKITLYGDDSLRELKPIAVRADWGAQSRYVLKADWIDRTHACNVVSAR